ncbi:14390_t:CDS:2 [Funneliformis geosporum]|uniref:14390_t:CDS:1 n=1 Tax=Funneliformis geosporum TaxID=1117311 RepID=A0A9W4SSP6_9GLOM|nr:14390_t:CDS:2 [Funneliformis geosporum]
MTMDFEELGEQIDLDRSGSYKILYANSDQQNYSMSLENILNASNEDNKLDSIDAKVKLNSQVIRVDAHEFILNKMSIEHLLLNNNKQEEMFLNCTDYFSGISKEDIEDFEKKEMIDDFELIINLSDNVINERTSIVESDDSINSSVIVSQGSGSDEQMERDVSFESSNRSLNFDDTNIDLLRDLRSNVLKIEGILNISQSETNVQEVTANVPIDDNQVDMFWQDEHQNDSTNLPKFQYLSEKFTEGLESEQDEQNSTSHQDDLIEPSMMIPEMHNELEKVYNDDKGIDVSINIIGDNNKETEKETKSNQLNEYSELMNEHLNFHEQPYSIFDNMIFEESYTSSQSDSFEEEELLPILSNVSVSDQSLDNNEIIISDDEKISSDLQLSEQVDTCDDKIKSSNKNILPGSLECEQKKSDGNEQNMNELSIGEKVIEDSGNDGTSKEKSHVNDSIMESIKCENGTSTSPKESNKLAKTSSVIVTRSMIASLNLKESSTSLMSLEEKKQLLLEVRKKKMMLHNSILRSEQEQVVGEKDRENDATFKSQNSLLSSKKKTTNKLNTTLNRLTRQNTDRNKEYRCEFNVVVVRKNVPKPLSPASKLHEKMKNGGGIISSLRSRNNHGKDNTGSHIPVLKSRGGRQNQDESSSSKGVHWDEERLTQELSHVVSSSPRIARQKPIPKSCLKSTNPPIDSLGNVIDADSSLTPVIKRGIKVTVKQIKYRGE